MFLANQKRGQIFCPRFLYHHSLHHQPQIPLRHSMPARGLYQFHTVGVVLAMVGVIGDAVVRADDVIVYGYHDAAVVWGECAGVLGFQRGVFVQHCGG